MPKKPNVLLVVIDCLRSDRVFAPDRTCRTPNIDRLVQGGTSFPNVFVENSMTAPSFSSFLTGRYGANHGVVGMVGVKLFGQAATMAEIFAANGYETYAEVTGPLNPILGLERGYSHYRCRNQKAYFFSDWGRDLLRRLQGGLFKSPYFLLVHFWEVHVPRQVRPEFDSSAYGATAYDRSLSGLDGYIGELLRVAGEDTVVILTSDHGECVDEVPGTETLLPYFLDKLNLPPIGTAKNELIDTTVELMAEKVRLHRFAAEIAQVTKSGGQSIAVGRRALMLANLLMIGLSRYRIQGKRGLRSGLFADFKQKVSDLTLFLNVARGRAREAQIELVRNSLNEHKLQHGYHIYDYLQRVPTVFIGSGIFPRGRRIETEVRHIDLLPTMIEAFGLETTADGFDGRSYQEELTNGGGASRSIYLEARGGAQAERVFLIRGIRADNRKLAYAPFEPNAPVEYYDLAVDPQECSNRADPENEIVRTLREQTESIQASFSTRSPDTLSPVENIEMVKKLKSLGYM